MWYLQTDACLVKQLVQLPVIEIECNHGSPFCLPVHNRFVCHKTSCTYRCGSCDSHQRKARSYVATHQVSFTVTTPLLGTDTVMAPPESPADVVEKV